LLSSRRRHTRSKRDWSSDVCSSDLLFHHLYAIIFKLYHKVWAYASIKELQAIVYAVTLSNLSTLIIQFLINDFTIYRRAMLITWLLHITLIGGSRFTWRVFRDHYINPNP